MKIIFSKLFKSIDLPLYFTAAIITTGIVGKKNIIWEDTLFFILGFLAMWVIGYFLKPFLRKTFKKEGEARQ